MEDLFYNFSNTEVKEEEEALVTELELSLENYKKCLLDVMEFDLIDYKKELLERKFSDIEIKVLIEQRARTFERYILKTEKIEELMKTCINKNVISVGKYAFFERLKKEVV